MAFGISWLKPEIDQPKYYAHIAILSFVVVYVLNWFGLNIPSDIATYVKVGIAITVADIIAHTLLRLD